MPSPPCCGSCDFLKSVSSTSSSSEHSPRRLACRSGASRVLASGSASRQCNGWSTPVLADSPHPRGLSPHPGSQGVEATKSSKKGPAVIHRKSFLPINRADRNRTCTPVKELDPKSSASASSATAPLEAFRSFAFSFPFISEYRLFKERLRRVRWPWGRPTLSGWRRLRCASEP